MLSLPVPPETVAKPAANVITFEYPPVIEYRLLSDAKLLTVMVSDPSLLSILNTPLPTVIKSFPVPPVIE